MKRQRHKSKSKKKPSDAAPAPAQPAKRPIGRRDFLGNTLIYTLGIGAVAGGGWYFGNMITASARETDLSTIGNGIPAIVQIHDPSCPTCTALQREAREAVCSLDDEKVQFLVANLNTEEGRRLATRHRVGKITLLLFDGEGNMRNVLAGPNSAENLKPVFASHAARYAQK